MTEYQLEMLEQSFPKGGVIIFEEPNGTYKISSFGLLQDEPHARIYNRLVNALTGEEPPKMLIDILNQEREHG